MGLFSGSKIVLDSLNAVDKLEESLETKKKEETPPDKWIEVEGFKGLHRDMTGYGGFQYELGKTYRTDDDIEPCKNGFHFCLNLLDIQSYGYTWECRSRYFRVKALVKESDYKQYGRNNFTLGSFTTVNKLVAKEITLVDELIPDEIYDGVESYLPKDTFMKYYASKSELGVIDFMMLTCAEELKGMYSDAFICVLMNKAANIPIANIPGEYMTKYKVDALRDMCIKAKALYHENVSPDIRTYLLLR